MKRLIISAAIAILMLAGSAWGEWESGEGRWEWAETPIEWSEPWEKASDWIKENYPGWQIYKTFRDYKFTGGKLKYYYAMTLHIPCPDEQAAPTITITEIECPEGWSKSEHPLKRGCWPDEQEKPCRWEVMGMSWQQYKDLLKPSIEIHSGVSVPFATNPSIFEINDWEPFGMTESNDDRNILMKEYHPPALWIWLRRCKGEGE